MVRALDQQVGKRINKWPRRGGKVKDTETVQEPSASDSISEYCTPPREIESLQRNGGDPSRHILAKNKNQLHVQLTFTQCKVG